MQNEMLGWGIRERSIRWIANTWKRMPGDCRSLCTFLSTSRTRLSGEWLRQVHLVAITSYILHVHRLYFKQEHHKWEFSPQKSTSTQQYLRLSFFSTPFQSDIPSTPFKLQSFLCSLVSWPICIQIFKALLFFRLILSFSFPVTLLASFFTLHYLVW